MGSRSKTLLLLLSGEHPTLPYSEALAILDSEGVPHREIGRFDQIFLIDAPEGCEKSLQERSAYVMEGGRLLFRSAPSKGDFTRACGDFDWGFLEGKSLGVKVTRVKDFWGTVDTQELQGLLGAAILASTDSTVDLKNPDVWIRGVVTDGGIFVFSMGIRTDRKAFGKRKPKSRPFFHPGVLEPKIARAFVNLSGARAGERFLDPFCGTGGFLIESALMGCSTYGMDLDIRMVKGARANLHHYSLEAEIVRGDAKSLPFSRLDAVATDPPYGRGTWTGGQNVRALLSSFLHNAGDSLKEGGKLCTAAPQELNPSDLAWKAGLTVLEEHSMRVHKSLTRSIIVAKRE